MSDVAAGAPGVSVRPDGAAVTADELARAFSDVRNELVSTLWYLLGNQEDACDAAQEAFLKCWRARARIGEVHNLRAWIFRIGLNAAKDFRRSAWHRRARPLKDETMLAANHVPVGQSLEEAETLERLRRAIQGLRREEQEVFLLRQNGELTYEEIAAIRNSPVGTVKTQMRSALQKLRRELA
jgi:RNA polymerase sigma-70 factor (ECF subfamily)